MLVENHPFTCFPGNTSMDIRLAIFKVAPSQSERVENGNDFHVTCEGLLWTMWRLRQAVRTPHLFS